MMKKFGISRILTGVALVAMTIAVARAQDPDDHTPSAPAQAPVGQRAQGGQGQRQRPEALPQMPGNGGDVNRDEIIAAERAGLDALKGGNMTAFAGTITDDAVFVDASGLARKPEVVKNVANFQLTDYTMSDVRFVPVSPDNGLIAYTLSETGTSHGKPFTAKVYVSSVWVRGGRSFVCVFSQETPAK